jgi:peptidoglycan/xylan/chitin deacetylase (PgdA/CDA1 family)
MILVFVVLLIVFLWLVYFLMPPPLGLPILMYHKISDHENDKLTISVDRLDEQLDCIKRLGYQPISFSDLRNFTQHRQPLPEKPVLLTFDDGYQTVYDLAYPLLKRHGFKATVFIPTKYIGGLNEWDGGSERIMDSETLSEMMRDRVEVGLHSHQHESYRSYSPSQIDTDISACVSALEQQQYPFTAVFAYPYGALPASRETRKALKESFRKHGIEFALRIGSRLNTFPLRDVYELKRIGINGTDSLRQFKTKLRKGRTKPF